MGYVVSFSEPLPPYLKPNLPRLGFFISEFPRATRGSPPSCVCQHFLRAPETSPSSILCRLSFSEEGKQLVPCGTRTSPLKATSYACVASAEFDLSRGGALLNWVLLSASASCFR